jgi:calcineurin-like phosphoesterase
MTRARRALPAALMVLALLGVWELYVDLGGVDPLILSSPHQIAKALFEDRSLLWSNFLVTAQEVLFGIVLAAAASLVVGTHTHVPTADHQILPGGTAYMTDAGMTGDYNSIIGMQKEEPLRRFTSGIPSGRFEPALGVATLSGVAVETDDATGLALQIAPVRIGGRLEPATPGFWLG